MDRDLSYNFLWTCGPPGSAPVHDAPCAATTALNNTALWTIVGRLTNLQNLCAYDHQCHPSFGPVDWARIARVGRYLYVNMFTGSVALPSLANLTSMDLSSNLFTGTVTWGSAPALQSLDLSGNQLTGTIAASISGLVSLSSLSLSGNQFTGSVPWGSLSALPSLQSVDLSGNQLTGSIAGIGDLAHVTFLNLERNAFTGSIPWSALGNMPQLTSLSLGSNPFESGSLPSSAPTNINQGLSLFNCSLTGTIPSSFGSISNLDLSNNRLTGTIPIVFANTSGLGGGGGWDFSNNMLTGGLSLEGVSIATSSLNFLGYFNVSGNRLTGSMPWDVLCQLFNTTLDTLDLHGNQFVGSIPDCAFYTAYVSHIDLSSNALSGTIPWEPLCYSDGTPSYIDLHGNQLSGTIADCFGATWSFPVAYWNGTATISNGSVSYLYNNQLQFLDVSSNALVGTVPASVENYIDQLGSPGSVGTLCAAVTITPSAARRASASAVLARAQGTGR